MRINAQTSVSVNIKLEWSEIALKVNYQVKLSRYKYKGAALQQQLKSATENWQIQQKQLESRATKTPSSMSIARLVVQGGNCKQFNAQLTALNMLHNMQNKMFNVEH